MDTVTHTCSRHTSPHADPPERAGSARRIANRSLRSAMRMFALAGLALCALQASAAPWAARHGLTGAQYQQAFNDFDKKGYRLTSISGYESGGGARYAALWSKGGGPASAARHGLNPQQYQAAYDDLAKKGYRLTFVNGYAVGGKPYYAGIWQKGRGPASAARHGMTAEQYQAAVDAMVKKGYALSHVSALSIGGSPRFAAIFEKGQPAWVARHGLTSGEYQKAFDEFTRKGYRLKVVSGYRQGRGDRYAAIWTKAGGPHWSARHGIKDQHYQHVFDNHLYQAYEPQYVQAFNGVGGVRFNGLWTNNVFKAQDLALIQNKARDYLKDNDVEGVSIAISRNEKLVYAAGFGKADVGAGEPVGPMHRFRVASVSKPITRVAVMRVVQDTNLDTGSKVFGPGSVLGGSYPTPATNPDIDDITVQHLIGHRGGWVNVNKDGADSDPMFAYSGTGHSGLITWTIDNYPLGLVPGAKYSYSNFGYSLLGRVIEAKTGKSYETYVRDAILKPAGANGMVIGGDKEADRKPNEVKYYGGGAYSSVKPQRFDAHGGWIATPIDLLRFMKHETVLETPYSHNGAMSGTKSVLIRRSDGTAYAATSNSSNGGTDKLKTMMEEITSGVSAWPSHDMF
ncbi:MAG: serine hydrolase [Pseudomonadota bacterium]|nr:serine hydrolase [Pseudomonadota bacterium]